MFRLGRAKRRLGKSGAGVTAAVFQGRTLQEGRCASRPPTANESLRISRRNDEARDVRPDAIAWAGAA